MDPILGFSVVAPESSAKMVIVPFRIPSTPRTRAPARQRKAHMQGIFCGLDGSSCRSKKRPFGETGTHTILFQTLVPYKSHNFREPLNIEIQHTSVNTRVISRAKPQRINWIFHRMPPTSTEQELPPVLRSLEKHPFLWKTTEFFSHLKTVF